MQNRPSLDTILQSALEIRHVDERAAYLDEACGDNKALRKEVTSLLAAHFAAENFMNTLADPVWQETPGEKEGDSIGRYKLLQQIGEGGFGTVYLAEQTEPVRRQVALKVIKAGMDSKEVIARFEAERQALALMDHPHIAKVHDAGTTEGGRPYFVMELVKGVPLTNYCKDRDLDTKERLHLFMDVCAAVQHAHQKGIIHRDLKPSNILVSPHDGKPVIKVIDFGIAKAISMELTEKTVFTQLGRMIGTPQYMSPEQAELNALDVDTRSDIYSLGVVLYELLTGTTPLDGTQLRSAAYGEMQRLIREETPPKPSTRVSAISQGDPVSADRRSLQGDLDWIVMKALEKDRTRRYETANALAQDLERHLCDEPVSAGPPSAGYRLKKFMRRNRRGLLSGAAAALALMVGLSVAGVVWLNATVKEGERMALIEGNASTLIDQAERLMEQNAAADYDDDSSFRQALNLVRQLENLVGIEETGEEVRTRRDRIMARVSSEGRDRDLILGIEESRMMWMGSGTFGLPAEVEKSIAEAFGKHGSDPINQPLAETVAWLEPRRDAVRGRIVAGMREWAGGLRLNDKTPDEVRKLTSIVASIDSDPWRQKLYEAIDKKDRVALEQLASSNEVSRQEIMTILGLAQALLVLDAPVKAEQLFRRVQREQPRSFWANFTLGNTLGELLESSAASSDSASRDDGMSVQRADRISGIKRRLEFDERVGFLRAAAAIRPDAAGAWSSLGSSLREGGCLKEAVACLQRAIELKPDMATLHADLGMALHEQGEFDKAIASHRKAIALKPDFASAHNSLGVALKKQGKSDEAIASYHQAIRLSPDNAITYVNLGIAYQEQGNVNGAIDAFRKASALEPHRAGLHLNLGKILCDRGEPGEAIASYRRAIQLDPGNAMAHNGLGDALRDQGEVDEAIASFCKVIELQPDWALAHLKLGNIFQNQGEVDKAIASYRKAIKLDPDDAEAHYNLGVTLQMQAKLDDAISSYRKAIQLDPHMTDAHNNLGVVLRFQGKIDEAIASHRKAIALDPDDAGAYNNLGSSLSMQGEPDKAIASYNRAIELDPGLVDAHANLGLILVDQDRLDEAIASFRKVIELKPQLAKGYFELGRALNMQGDFDDAIKAFDKAIELDPDSALAHSNLGWCLHQSGDLDGAITHYRKAIELDSDLLLAFHSLVVAFMLNGELVEAEKPFREFLRLSPDPSLQADLEHTLSLDVELLGVLREHGVGHRSVSELVQQISLKMPFLDTRQDLVRKFWENHPEQVLRELEKREVTMVVVPKGNGAQEIAEEIRDELGKGATIAAAKDQFDGQATFADPQTELREGFHPPLQETIFATPVGGVGEIVDFRSFLWVIKVHASIPRKADKFDDPGVEEAAKTAFERHRREEWEKNYLEHLQHRINEEQARPSSNKADPE